MNQAFYMAAVGAHQQMRHLNVAGDNIANVNSVGYKANKPRFINLMYQQDERTTEEPIRYGVGTRLLMTSTDFRQGGASDTGRSLDYMIEGEGFFALADLATGEVSFTRNGAFTMAEFQRDTGAVDEDGQTIYETVFCLSDGNGRFVLSDQGSLIEVTDRTVKLPVGIFDYSNYDGMTRVEETRFLPVGKNGNLWAGTGTLHQGKLEMSNADLAEELTRVIEAQRAYGLALKMMQTSDEIETTINNLRS